MGVFSRILNAASRLINALSNISAEESVDETESESSQLEEQKSALIESIGETLEYGIMADERYYSLKEEDLLNVPAVDLYDGPYEDSLLTLETSVEEVSSQEELSTIQTELTSIATQIQSFLNEETSDIDCAMLWDSKFQRAAVEHLVDNSKDNYDAVMAAVMEAYRRVAETSQYAINLYGSQNLINAVYEEVSEGGDALTYMDKILQLNYEHGGSMSWNGEAHEQVIVPNADGFSSGFFL